MSPKPTVDGLNLAVCYAANTKGLTLFDIIGVAGAFDAYLAGMIEAVPIEVTSDNFQVAVNLKPGNETTNTSGGVAAGSLRSIRGHEEPDDSLAACIIPFIERLSDSELAAINSGAIPKFLMRLLSRVAYNEIKLRRGE